MNGQEQFIEAVDRRTSEWWKGAVKAMEGRPPLGQREVDDQEFYARHKEKAEGWAAQGDPHYFAALAVVAPKEAERFVRIAKVVAAEEALKRYG